MPFTPSMLLLSPHFPYGRNGQGVAIRVKRKEAKRIPFPSCKFPTAAAPDWWVRRQSVNKVENFT